MAGPWEKYAAPAEAGPWTKYGGGDIEAKKAAQLAADRELYDPTRDMTAFEKVAAGFGKTFADTGRGIGQALGLVSQEDVDEAAQTDRALMNTGAGVVGNIGGQAAQMVIPGGLIAKGAAKALPAAVAASKALPYVTAAANGGAFSAAQPVVTGDTRAGNAATGAAFGAAGQAVASGVARVAKGASDLIAPEIKALYDKAMAAGIPVNIAQLSDSKFLKVLQSTVERLPFTGAQASRTDQQQAFNWAVSKTFGEDALKVTRDVYARAKDRIGGQFNQLSARNALKVDDTSLLGRLEAVTDEATRFASDDTARAVTSAIDELLGKVDAAGAIPGKAYQSLDSKLSKLMKAGGEKSMYLGQVRDTVRNAMDGSISAADKEAWRVARRQYKNLKTVRDLVAKEGADGNISPAQLMSRLNASQAGKEANAMGLSGEMGDLAQIGRQFVRDPIPSSGTAERLTALGALGGGGYFFGVDPTTTLMMLAGAPTRGRGVNALLGSGAGGRYMTEGGGKALNMLAQGARTAPVLLPATANATRSR